PARQPCVLYSVTGSNTQARGKLHGLVWLPPDFTVLVSTEHTSGALAGLAGALLASRLDSGLPGAGNSYELQSIAAAVIGGVLLTGGVGTLFGPLAGVLLLGVIENVINQVGTLSPYYQNLASGAFLLLAVIAQTLLTGKRRKR
ncbi:ABC transporter permease subunit, partial [Burkholderia cenocepacia]|uniref:ABC transporter permease subunit n=5 Tax=Burkholderia cenocepacia TaxID=95486 RepID=UPI00387E19E3